MTKIVGGYSEDGLEKVDGFLFVSGLLALDLVNTEIARRGKGDDLLKAPQDLAQWWQLALTHHSVEIANGPGENHFDADLLAQVKQLRAALRLLCSNINSGEFLNETELQKLNQVLSMGSPTLSYNNGQQLKQTYRLQQAKGAAILFQLALSALQLFSGSDLSRLHKCRNDRCVLYFYDNTRSGTRHWCSLGCMNRARSIQHYKQSKKAKEDISIDLSPTPLLKGKGQLS